MVLGLPFNLFWLILWILITPLVMWIAYRIEVPPDFKNTSQGAKGGA